jgi:UDP-glucose 4-epimerase
MYIDLSGQKVLVIGGAGFIGSHVVEALLTTPVQEIVIYDNFTRGSLDNLRIALGDPRCNIYSLGGDIRDLDLLDDAMQGCDSVIHLAAMWLLHCLDFPRTAFNVNIEGTFNVLEACVRHRVKRLIYSSSASVYGDAVEIPMDETHPFNNRNFYGATKISGEAMCRAYYERYGLSFVGLRYMNVYGPRQDQRGAYTGVIPTLLNNIDSGVTPLVYGDGSQAYDFIYVEDVAKANILALQSKADNSFYNIGTGIKTSIRDLVYELIKAAGSSLIPRFEPYTKEDIRQHVTTRVGSTLAARRDLDFEYTTSLKDGLCRLVDWRRSQK